MPEVSIELTATENTTVTPRFDFSSGTVKAYINNVYNKDLTSGAEDSIALSSGEVIKYTASDWDSITRIDINSDKVSGDISGWALPNSLAIFRIFSTSVSGDISGWTLPNSLVNFYINLTSLSGNISGWTLPNSLVDFRVFSTSLSYESSAGAFTGIVNNLEKIGFNNCLLPQVQVDNILADCVASGIDNSSSAKTVEVGGNNASPSVAGLIHKTILEARGWTTAITAASSFHANGLTDNMMFLSQELDQHDVNFFWNNGNGREELEPFLGRLNRPLDYPLRRGRYTF